MLPAAVSQLPRNPSNHRRINYRPPPRRPTLLLRLSRHLLQPICNPTLFWSSGSHTRNPLPHCKEGNILLDHIRLSFTISKFHFSYQKKVSKTNLLLRPKHFMCNQLRPTLSKPLMQPRNPARSLHMFILIRILERVVQRLQLRSSRSRVLGNDFLVTGRTVVFLPLQVSTYGEISSVSLKHLSTQNLPGFRSFIRFLRSGIGSPELITHKNSLICTTSNTPTTSSGSSSEKISISLNVTFSGQKPCGGAFARLISEASIVAPAGSRGDKEVLQIPVPQPISAMRVVEEMGGMEGWRWVVVEESQSWCWRLRRTEARAWKIL